MENEEHWKNKYLANLEQVETLERRLNEAEDLMRLTVARLTLAADGIDPELDDQLDTLRREARKKKGNATVGAIIDQIAHTITRLDSERAAGRLALLPPPLLLSRIISSIDFPRGLTRKARKIDKKLNKKKARDELDVLLQEVAALITEAIDWAAELEETSTSPDIKKIKPGLVEDDSFIEGAKDILNRMIAELSITLNDNDRIESVISQLDAARTKKEIEQLGSRLTHLFRATSESQNPELSQEPVATPLANEITVDSTDSAPARFTEFIDLLSLPDDLAKNAKRLRDQLADTVEADTWPALLSDIADLIAQMRIRVENEKNELQSFLKQLTERLQEIDLSLQTSEQVQDASFSSGKELDVAVRSNLQNLETSVSEATDLPALKQAIGQRMENIYAHLQQFRENEDKHKADLLSEMTQLKTRLGTLESESSELQQRLEREREQAMLDPLTGIMNRIAYDKRMQEETARWKRYKTPLSLIICDIDKFKNLNDTLGHQAGDKALQSITVVLKNNVRETDLLARYGGEEFVILLPNTRAIDAGKAAENIRLAVEKASFKYQGKPIPVTISCGYAEFSGTDTSDDVFQRADKYLYQAKNKGRNCCIGDKSS